MEKIKWKYSSKDKHWYVNESKPYANDGFFIAKDVNNRYALHFDNTTFTPRFKRLSEAKMAATLLRNAQY